MNQLRQLNNSETIKIGPRHIKCTQVLFFVAIFGLIIQQGAHFVLASLSNSTISGLVGPRQGMVNGAPSEYGFWSFSIPSSGILSRSGQPTVKEFNWLRKNGWKSVIDLRFDGEYMETADDTKLPGFNKLGFRYLRLQIRDGQPPTDAQANKFLQFIKNTLNQPAHIHCRGGYGRTGTLVALYRYEVDKWTMTRAIQESRLYHGGISVGQNKWLLKWAQKNKAVPGKLIIATTSDKLISSVANPASSNCMATGGNLVIRKRGDDGEYGLCNFDDNKSCEEWALMRGGLSCGWS